MSEPQRLFLALWPSTPLRERLLGAQRQVRGLCAGRAMQSENLHLTLHFLGGCTLAQRACIEALAAQVAPAVAPFTLVLDHFGHWPRPRIAYVGPSVLPEPLTALVTRLGEGLPACGLTPEARPYRPHVTLARKAGAPGGPWPTPPSLHWRVERFVLVHSRGVDHRVDYAVVAEWPLARQNRPPASQPDFT